MLNDLPDDVTSVLMAGIALAAWLVLGLARGGFWRILGGILPILSVKNVPKNVSITAVIPARDEAGVIGRAVKSLLSQRFSGLLRVIVVDDHSIDGTAAAARAIGSVSSCLQVIAAGPLPQGWTGKLWALSEGLREAAIDSPDFFLLTDADILHSPDNIERIAGAALAGGLDLVSLMVRLRCESLAERALIPAFVFFFFLLYPPSWIANPKKETAGAAGGCILIRPEALERIGGLQSIRGELIDDCALARAVKGSGGRIRLGVTADTHSIREYGGFADIERMIRRTAYTQLGYSPWLLAGTLLGMALVYLAPPALVFMGNPTARVLAALAWLLMALLFVPTLRFYRQSVLWAPLLPLIAAFYMWATLDSAFHYWTGRGGEWKGRVSG